MHFFVNIVSPILVLLPRNSWIHSYWKIPSQKNYIKTLSILQAIVQYNSEHTYTVWKSLPLGPYKNIKYLHITGSNPSVIWSFKSFILSQGKKSNLKVSKKKSYFPNSILSVYLFMHTDLIRVDHLNIPHSPDFSFVF